MDSRKLIAIAGFVVLGLSPSYYDWKDNPERRAMIAAFYLAGALLVYKGRL